MHAAFLLAGYLFSLAYYLHRTASLQDLGLAASLLFPALLEILVFLCIGRLLLGEPGRLHRWRNAVYALLACLITATYLVQCYALLTSNAFVSVLAMENTAEAFLTASRSRNLYLATGALVCLGMIVLAWRGSAAPLRQRSRIGLLIGAGLAFATTAVLNAGTSVGGGTARLENGQSPFASLIRAASSLAQADPVVVVAGAAPSQNTVSCKYLSMGTGSFPFLKQTINTTPLPFHGQSPIAQPNIIVLFLEGTSARLMETYGGHYAGLTPNISRMGRDALVVDNYFNHTAATFRGLQGQLTSGFPRRGGAEKGAGWMEHDNARSYAKNTYMSLPRLLHEKGYQTVFFSPHKKADAMTALVTMLGFDDIYTMERSRRKMLKNPDEPYREALTDKDSFRTLVAFLQHNDSGKPFFITLYNLGTHAFLDNASHGISYKDGRNASLNTLHNLDARFGAFYDYFLSSRYADNTLLVVTSDHAHYPEPAYVDVAGSGYKPLFVDRIPLLIRAPWLSLPPRFDTHGRTSLDLTPTLLHLLDINEGRNSFLGHSIFEQQYNTDFALAPIGKSIYAIHDGEVYPPNQIPGQTTEQYESCARYVKAYYAHEASNTVFPSPEAANAP